MKSIILGIGLSLIAAQAMATPAEDFAKLTPQQALEQGNEWYHSTTASVQTTPDYIVARFADGKEARVPTGDKFPISVAPYFNQNHPCGYHVATSCTGELKNAQMTVKITDLVSHKVLVSGPVTTGPNGFADFWLPKNRAQLQFTFSYMGKSATQVLSTEPKARTCITDMKLL